MMKREKWTEVEVKNASKGKTGRAGGGRSWPVRREGGSKGDGRRGPRPPRRASLAGVRIHHHGNRINHQPGGRGTLLITYCCFTIHSGRRWRRSAVENSICTTSQLASNSSSPETPRGECFNFNR